MLSRKYLKKGRTPSAKSASKKALTSTAAMVEQKLSGFDRWLFGEDIKEKEVRLSES